MSDRLAGKTVIVTGAGRGLGRAFAQRIAEEGASVAIAEVDQDLGRQAAAQLADARLDVAFIHTNVADARSVRQMVEQVVSRWGHIDGLVNNAAMASGLGGQPFDRIAEAQWDQVMAVNVRGVWLCCREVVPHMRRAGKGKIVNIASDTALWGAPRLLHYVASKGAVIALTRSLSREVGEHHIAVNVIAPGLTLVEATEAVSAELHHLNVESRAMKRQQHPDDVTGAVVFLLSDDADFITGQLLPVNGGFVLN